MWKTLKVNIKTLRIVEEKKKQPKPACFHHTVPCKDLWQKGTPFPQHSLKMTVKHSWWQ